MSCVAYVYFAVLLAMSVITLIFFAADKKNSSREGKGRIPEIVLLSLCSFGGALGTLIGMYVLRHKTNPITKFHFFVTLWLSLAIQAALAVLMLIQLF
jgi:uncharacterized membrane protein YsdA (DUF1294 family)